MEDVFYEKLELKKDAERTNNLEHLGQAMLEAGNEFGPSTAYGEWCKFVFFVKFFIKFSASVFLEFSALNP